MTAPVLAHPDHARRLRARRIAAPDLRLGTIRVSARHPVLGLIRAEVKDLSLHGMGLTLPETAPTMVLAGDRLDGLRVHVSGQVLDLGSAIVRRQSEVDGALVLGVELESTGIDLGELYRRVARHTFAERWAGVDRDARNSQLTPAFKAWVADLRAYLDAAKGFLDAEEAALASEDRLTREQAFQQYLEEVAPPIAERLDAAGAELGAMVKDLTEAEHAAYRAFCRGHLAPLFAHSPFMRRASEKPLGYAGDYEMMNMLYRDHAEGDSLFGRALNLYATREAAALANINRIDYLGEKIRDAVRAAGPGRARLASIGCGPAAEIGHLLQHHPEVGPHVEIALIDQEERSIAYCERTLSPLARATGARIHFIRDSIRRLLGARKLSETLGERDLVYSAGLFDYLNDRTFTALAGSLYDALVPGGLLAIGNVAAENPSRWAMEYFSEWFLIHRTRADLAAFGEALTPRPQALQVDSEPLGVNLFLLVRR